jgi:hypothetical protein
MVCGPALAAALTADKSITSRSGEFAVLSVESGTVIYAGALIAVDTNDYAVSASDTATLKVIGVANAGVDQRAGVYDSSKTLLARRGVFLFKNGGSLTDANIGDWAYVEDDQTVSTAAEMSNDVLAGVIVDVDTTGVWVDVGAVNRAGAIAGDTLDTTGNAAVGGTLDVTGASTLGGTLGVTGAATLTGNAIANELDARTATALLLGKATATSVTIGAADADVSIPGALGVTGVATFTGNAIANELDARTATALLFGKATATSVTIGASDADVSIPGALGVTGAATLTGNAIANELDARTATALLLGKATATSVTIGASDANVSVPGALGVTGASTLTGNIPAGGTLNVAGASTFTGAVTQVATPVFAQAAVTAPTNAISQGLAITVNGTNYVVALYAN